MDPAVETHALSKRYRAVQAVDEVTLRVDPGEVYGFLGLNGAGKTTTIRALLGMIRPTGGTVHLLGERVGGGGRGPWRRVGHLVETATAYPELTVHENLEIARRLYHVTDPAATGRALERFGLAPQASRRAGALSLGTRQRLALARALLHDPALVILDEPTNGLDPAGVREVRELLRALAHERGVAVFMSSHLLAEVDQLATRIGILRAGRLVEELDVADLERLRARRLAVDARDREAARAVLAADGYVGIVTAPDGSLALSDPRALAAPDEVARQLVAGGAPPTRLAVVQESLEAYFLARVGGRA